MPKAKTKGSVIGLIGGVLVGAAVLLFVTTIILNNLKTTKPHSGRWDENYSNNSGLMADWNTTNDTIDTIQTMMTVSAILLAVMGIVIVGANIIGYIGGGFGT